jgi:hypothetical protein
MDMSIYLIAALSFVAVAIVIVIMCDPGGKPRRKRSDGYDGRDNGGWSFGESRHQTDFFSSDD